MVTLSAYRAVYGIIQLQPAAIGLVLDSAEILGDLEVVAEDSAVRSSLFDLLGSCIHLRPSGIHLRGASPWTCLDVKRFIKARDPDAAGNLDFTTVSMKLSASFALMQLPASLAVLPQLGKLEIIAVSAMPDLGLARALAAINAQRPHAVELSVKVFSGPSESSGKSRSAIASYLRTDGLRRLAIPHQFGRRAHRSLLTVHRDWEYVRAIPGIKDLEELVIYPFAPSNKVKPEEMAQFMYNALGPSVPLRFERKPYLVVGDSTSVTLAWVRAANATLHRLKVGRTEESHAGAHYLERSIGFRKVDAPNL